MPTESPNEITLLLAAASRGEARASERLLARIYDELKELARVQLRGERASHTLQSTDLVNEALA